MWDCHDFRYYKPSKESLYDFLKSVEIKDEYGRKFTFDEFINDELHYLKDGKQHSCIDEGWDITSYYEKKGFSGYTYYEPKENISRYKEQFNIDVNIHGEFYIENLRFTVSDDFR